MRACVCMNPVPGSVGQEELAAGEAEDLLDATGNAMDVNFQS